MAQDAQESLRIAQECPHRIGGNKLEMRLKTGAVSVRCGQERAVFGPTFHFFFFRRRARPIFPSKVAGAGYLLLGFGQQ